MHAGGGAGVNTPAPTIVAMTYALQTLAGRLPEWRSASRILTDLLCRFRRRGVRVSPISPRWLLEFEIASFKIRKDF